ncbi:MAG: efflux RND transporter periplasmic adaptor subunit [Proteobacteria bacterium]|nr:efflux RND transporter periplasmic adaptor subunit [Pseudomonadota bacterium]
MLCKTPFPFQGGAALRKRIVVIFLILLVGVGILVYCGQKKVREGEFYYSGTIEATQAHLAFQTGGRVLRVEAREGQAVAKDQPLAELDPAEFRSRHEQAKANLERSVKNREQAETMLRVYEKTLPAEVGRAEAGVGVLRSQLDELRAGTRPQDIERANQAMQSAASVMEDAKRNMARYEALFKKGIISEKEWDAARLRYDMALREYERSREMHDLAREGSRAETIRTAEARVAEGVALLKQARSNLIRIDAARKDVEAALTLVAAARAALDQMEIQLAYTQLKAPQDGIITSRSIEPGEVVTPGREVMTLSSLAMVDLKIFVAETEIGKVKPGQKAEVRVDTFPEKTFAGTVTFISPEGEFTPKIIQTRKERVKLVYLVKVSISNPSYELKSGMPADARLR